MCSDSECLKCSWSSYKVMLRGLHCLFFIYGMTLKIIVRIALSQSKLRALDKRSLCGKCCFLCLIWTNIVDCKIYNDSWRNHSFNIEIIDKYFSHICPHTKNSAFECITNSPHLQSIKDECDVLIMLIAW